jgi:hypothetical protein
MVVIEIISKRNKKNRHCRNKMGVLKARQLRRTEETVALGACRVKNNVILLPMGDARKEFLRQAEERAYLGASRAHAHGNLENCTGDSQNVLPFTGSMQTTQASYWSRQKKEIARICKPSGIVITFGWNSGRIGETHSFEIVEILMVAHGGWHNDIICAVERKTHLKTQDVA